LALTTIEGHFARGIAEGKLQVENLMEKKDIEAIAPHFQNKHDQDISLKDVFTEFNGEYSFGQLRMVKASLQETKEED